MRDLLKFLNHLVIISTILAFAPLRDAPSASAAETEKAVRDAVQRYADAWNSADLKAIAACWSPDGEFIEPSGTVTKVGDLLKEQATELSGDNRPKLNLEVTAVRFAAPGVALVDGTSTVTHASPTAIDQARFSSVYLLRNGTWLVSRVHHLDAPTAQNNLEELAWLIGSWEGISDESTVRSTVRWSENRKFLVRKFQVEQDGRTVLTGTQRIGWNPITQTPKSWHFDSDGSFGEGLWQQQDGHWVVTVHGVLEDGTEVSATNIYTRLDDDHILRQSLGTRIGNQNIPDREIRVVRTNKAS